jgi:hypothetical protein
MLNYTRNILRDAPLAGATQLEDVTVNFYTENPLVCRKLQFAEATTKIVDVLDIFFTQTKIRAIYFSNVILVSEILKLKNGKIAMLNILSDNL